MEVVLERDSKWNLLINHIMKEEPIIIPTDTNYNLCCLPESEKAIDLIFKYKKRNKDKPLSLFFLDPKDWLKYGRVENPKLMDSLISEFWPGPLNIVVENLTPFSYMLNNNTSVALGCVSNKTWRKLMERIDKPLAITSANISGTADNLLITEDIAQEHMGHNVQYMLKSENPIKTTRSSTIISLLNNQVKILREGDITVDMIDKVVRKEGYHVI